MSNLHSKIPEMPEPAYFVARKRFNHQRTWFRPDDEGLHGEAVYSAGQMVEYGRQCATAHDEVLAEVVGALERLLAFHTESVNFTPEVLSTALKFEEFADAMRAQKMAAEEGARAALSKAAALLRGGEEVGNG